MKEILAFGDSNTYGLIPKTTSRYDRNTRWTSVMERIMNERGDEVHIVEEGLCGRTTVFEDQFRSDRRGLDMLPAILESHGPLDGVILMLGTNDCKSYYKASAEIIGLGIERLIKQIRSQSEVTKILLVSPIYLGDKVYEEEFDPEFDCKSVVTSKRLKDVYMKIAKKYKVDFLAASDYVHPSDTDQEHMSEEGHSKLAEVLANKIIKEWNDDINTVDLCS